MNDADDRLATEEELTALLLTGPPPPINNGGGQSPKAETRSAPGDLSEQRHPAGHFFPCEEPRPGTSHEVEAPFVPTTTKSQPPARPPPPLRTHPTTNEDSTAATSAESGRRRGHLRGTRSNGFASAPPFTRKPAKRGSEPSNRHTWGADERQKQQQIQLIEQEIDMLAKDSRFGLGSWRPAILQPLASKLWMIVLLCWFCTIQGMLINGLIPSSISTIERRFQLSTSTLGRIMQFYDVGYVICCIPVSYFGGRHSKPAVLAAGLALMSVGSLLFTAPHLLAEPHTNLYDNEAAGLSKCPATNSTSTATLEEGLATINEFSALQSCPSPENQPGNFRYVFLFSLAHFLHGIGATPLFTIGVSYIDENVGPALSSLYLGIFYAFAIFGPAFGFLASSTFLRWHTDFMQTGQKFASIWSLDETDPRWVGAWYIGFMLASVLGLLAVLPIAALPKVLPESLKWHRTRLREEAMGFGAKKKGTPECCGMPSSSKMRVIAGSRLQLDEEGSTDGKMAKLRMPTSTMKVSSGSSSIFYQFWMDIRDIPLSIYRVLMNGPYMLITLGMAIDGLIVTGCSTFMSKYLERQFGVPPSKANMLIGAVMVPMAGMGTLLAGFIIHHYRMSCVRTLQFCVALVVCSLLLSPMFFIYCDHDQLVGVEGHYPVDGHLSQPDDFYTYTNTSSNTGGEHFSFHLRSNCNRHCACSPAEYHPVCAEFVDGSQVAYYSPCYAGCPEEYAPLQKQYLNCSCVPPNTKGGHRRVKRGFCESKCSQMFVFLIFFAPFCFFTFAVGVSLITVVLRTVDYNERSFALGIQWILVRIAGTIPAPVVFGWLFDVSCRLYGQHGLRCSTTTSGSGSCMVYNNKGLADLFLAFSVAGQLAAIVCLLAVLMFFSGSLRDDPLPVRAADAPTFEEAMETGVGVGTGEEEAEEVVGAGEEQEEVS